MNCLFVDTGAFVSRVLSRDQYHKASVRGWRALEDIDVRLYSSEHVLDEAISLLARQAGHRLPIEITGGLWQWSKRAKEAQSR